MSVENRPKQIEYKSVDNRDQTFYGKKTFVDGVESDHNLLLNKQGGVSGEYYHLTADQYSALGSSSGLTQQQIEGLI